MAGHEITCQCGMTDNLPDNELCNMPGESGLNVSFTERTCFSPQAIVVRDVDAEQVSH